MNQTIAPVGGKKKRKKIKDMAIAIRPIPTLYGEDAERFDQMVCEAEEKKANIDISNNIRLVKEFLRKQNW